MAQKSIDPNFLTEVPQPVLDTPGLNYDKVINTEENVGFDQLTLNSFTNKVDDEEYSVCKIIKVFSRSEPKPGFTFSLRSTKDEKDMQPVVQAIGINVKSRDIFIPFPSNINDIQGIDKYTQGLFTYIYSDSESIIAQNLKVNDIVYVEYDLGDTITGAARIIASKPTTSGRSSQNTKVPVSNPVRPSTVQPPIQPTPNLLGAPIEGDPNREYDGILVCGLEKTSARPTYLTFEQQLQILKNGYGVDRNVKAFSYTVSDAQLGSILQNNNIPVFLFSAGANKVRGVLRYLKDKRKLFVIEPWNKNNGYLPTFNFAVSQGVPAANFFIGPTVFTGQGLTGATPTNSGGSIAGHFNSLETVGRLKSNIR